MRREVKTVKKLKEKACGNCEEKFLPKVPLQSVCSVLCAIELGKKKAEEKESKEWKERKSRIAESLKTITDYEKEARVFFQQWIRLRDKDLPCISCGVTECREWHGSHYFDAYTFSGLIFDERNCHKSCNKCNTFLHGNKTEYRKGLIERYGIEYVEDLESESNSKREYKFSKGELIDIKKKYTTKIKELKNGRNLETS